MAQFLLLILVFLGVAVYFMTAAERTRFVGAVGAALLKMRETVTLERLHSDPFFNELRARTPRVIAMPLLVMLSAAIFLFFGAAVVDVFISAVCLWQMGFILERLVGPIAFTTVYAASGIAAAIVRLSASSVGLSIAASEPVLGLYGLLLVTSAWSIMRESSLAIPLKVAKQLAAVAAIFGIYKLATSGLWDVAAFAALACGVIGGLVAGRELEKRTPHIRRLATAMAMVITAVTLYSALALQRPVNETVDVRPEIDRVIFVESRTARLYEGEVDRFRKGRITAAALAVVIDKQIVPELRLAAARLRGLQDVPSNQRPLVTSAETFLKLRDESWRMRAAALHTSDMRALRQADSKEQVSREAFHRLTPPLLPDPSQQPSS